MQSLATCMSRLFVTFIRDRFTKAGPSTLCDLITRNLNWCKGLDLESVSSGYCGRQFITEGLLFYEDSPKSALER